MLTTEFLIFLTLGVLFQSLLILRQDIFKRNVASTFILTFLFSLIGFFPGKREREYDPNRHFLISIIIYCVIFSLSLREHVLQIINERIILIYSLVFMFFAYQNSPYLLLLAIPFLLYAVYHNFRHINMRGREKLVFYVIFLTISVFITGSQLIKVVFPSLGVVNFGTYTSLNAFIFGILIFLFIQSFSNLVYLLPIPGKRQKFKDRWKDVVEHANILTNKFSDEQSRRIVSLVIIVMVSTFLAVNSHYKYFDNNLVFNLILATVPLLELVHEKFTFTLNKK